ncbi:MAG: hypothetical protein LUM44_21190 [Pyrinomonadaceae bacterium]|nr:hypothetical protein [Pyrinomonadaceae bacterium]
MKRNILLVEPNYSNKYPPIGLMKIATYHRMLGDDVRFYKGNMQDFIIDLLYEDCVEKLMNIDSEVPWRTHKSAIKRFIKLKKNQLIFLEELGLQNNDYKELILRCLIDFADYYRKKKYIESPRFDRIYVTTLFTFYWKITIETINFCKYLVKDINELKIGGVLASLLPTELENEVRIKPITGLLDKPGELDPEMSKAKKIIIDNLPLDYSILDEIEYEYPTKSAYFTFMTKGCTRKCAFCSVPKLEPEYKPKIETIDKFQEVKKRFGDQQNLLLMDNNVLASPKFHEIIDEIKDMGFHKGATYVEPNQLEIAVKNLESGFNDKGLTRRAFRLMNELISRLKGDVAQNYYDILADKDLLNLDTVTKEKILEVYPHIKDTYEKYRNKTPRLRYVDFNQGTDCRYVTEDLMKKMSEIPIRPLRIAFDYLGLREKYTEAVRLAAKYGIKELSNYILYNFNDKPEELYERLKINVELGKEFGVAIFSFPMKFIPLFGDEAKHRQHTGKFWNKKFVRAVQSILNVSKGIVAPYHPNKKATFFYEAFGKDLDEFFEILHMPETYIIYRHLCRHKLDYTKVWEEEYRSLSVKDLRVAQEIIRSNDFSNENILKKKPSKKVKHFMRHYRMISRNSIEENDKEYKKIKKLYDDMIKNDQFIDLTLTYDFEATEDRKLNYDSQLPLIKYARI